MNMREGRFIGYIIALALGSVLVFGTFRFLGYGIGVSETTELDWSTCRVEAIMNPRNGPLHDIRCDEATILFESMPGVGGSQGATGSIRQVQAHMHEEKTRGALSKSFFLSGWKRANEDIQASSQGHLVNGFVTDKLTLIDITKDEDEEGFVHGKGLMSVILNGDRAYVALCVSRTKTRELCEGAIVDLFEARDIPILDALEQFPEGVVATLDEPREDKEGAAAEVEQVEQVEAEEPEPIKELTAAERAEAFKRGGELYLTQCASCHNVGMTRAPSAPKMGSPFWGNALSKGTGELISAAKSKCKDERDGDEFSHMITDREMAMALQHVLITSSSR